MHTKRETIKYRQYDIFLIDKDSGSFAAAYLVRKKLAEANASSQEAVLLQLKHILDERDQSRKKSRVEGVPTAEEFAEALTALESKISDAQWMMLKTHYNSQSSMRPGERELTAEGLANAAGYKNWSAGNLHYGRLGRLLGEFLSFTPVETDADGQPIWTFVLATNIHFQHKRMGVWKLRKEVSAALEKLAIVSPHTAFTPPPTLDLSELEFE